MKILEWQPQESACNYALRVLLHNIVHLELAPGSKVSSTKLAEALSLSRMPIREALSELSRLGLVDILPQRGTYVSKINYDFVEESRFMRLVLETAVVRLACETGVSRKSLDAMRENLQAYRTVQDGDSDLALELDNSFHRLIFASVNKLWTYQNLKKQMIHFDRLRTLSLSLIVTKAEDTLKDHEDIFYAINRQDSEMGEMMVKRHLTHYQVDFASIKQKYPEYFVNPKTAE